MILGLTALERVVVAAYSYHSPQTPLRKSKGYGCQNLNSRHLPIFMAEVRFLLPPIFQPLHLHTSRHTPPQGSSSGLIKRSVTARAFVADRNAVHVTGNHCATEAARHNFDRSLFGVSRMIFAAFVEPIAQRRQYLILMRWTRSSYWQVQHQVAWLPLGRDSQRSNCRVF